MTTNPLDAIQARADLAQGAWEEFNLGIATTRFALDEANNSAEDVPRLLAALRAVEAVLGDADKQPGPFKGITSTTLVSTAIREALNG